LTSPAPTTTSPTGTSPWARASSASSSASPMAASRSTTPDASPPRAPPGPSGISVAATELACQCRHVSCGHGDGATQAWKGRLHLRALQPVVRSVEEDRPYRVASRRPSESALTDCTYGVLLGRVSPFRFESSRCGTSSPRPPLTLPVQEGILLCHCRASSGCC